MNPRRNLQTRKNRRKRNERWQKEKCETLWVFLYKQMTHAEFEEEYPVVGDPRIALSFRRQVQRMMDNA